MKRLILTSFLLFASVYLFAQQDRLILSNGDVIVGEIKSMDKGVLQIETPYSDSDFLVEIEGIKEIYSSERFLFTTSEGERYTGTFKSDENGNVTITEDETGQTISLQLEEIVYINSLDDSFASRINANIDFGYSLTKANNQQQLTSNLRIGYLADYWSLDLYFNSLISTQDDVEDIQRNDIGLGYRYFLPKDWYLSADITFLSNTEQSLDLRSNGRLGVGKFVVHSNSAYWSFSAGGSYNNETFNRIAVPSETAPDSTYQPDAKRSVEGYFGTELNLYDIGDLNLLANIIAYPSFTEVGRWRTDARFDAKYDDFLIQDFYIRLGFTVNYDNQPVEAGKELDYVFSTGFGWEW